MEKFEGDYKCKWCGYEFTQQVGYIPNEKRQLSSGGCSAVNCPHCGNGLRPRIDAVSIRELEFKRGEWK